MNIDPITMNDKGGGAESIPFIFERFIVKKLSLRFFLGHPVFISEFSCHKMSPETFEF